MAKNKPLLFVGLDVGGTTMKSGVVNDDGKALGKVVQLPTEAHLGQEHGLNRMCETIRAAVSEVNCKMEDIAAIGVATPGTMDIPAGMILEPPNLKPWRNVPVRQFINDTFGLPTAFQNDANAAALGEFWVGVGKDVDSMVLFTLGTGVGCGIIIHGEVLEGQHSHGAEVGHMRIELTNPRRCGCGRLGCLEAYASATSVVKRTREILAESKTETTLRVLEEEDDELSSRTIFEAAAHGDALAQKIVDDTAFYLAVGATNMMHTIDPDMVVFGGGMTAAGEPLLSRIQENIKKLAFPVPAAKTKIVFAELGSDAGFIGAAGCARKLWQKTVQKV